jgi:steroid delta-isomerase-like uncharacterized protein
MHGATIVRDYVDALNTGSWERLRALFTPEATVQGVLGALPVDDALPIWRELHEGMEMRLEVDDLVESESTVVTRYTERGRFVGSFRGLPGAAPTRRPYTVTAMEWFEISDGRIHRRWGARDSATISRQVLG